MIKNAPYVFYKYSYCINSLQQVYLPVVAVPCGLISKKLRITPSNPNRDNSLLDL